MSVAADDAAATRAVVGENGELELTLDENGEAEFVVSAELLGTAVLKFSVEDADVTAQTTVNVVEPELMANVKNVTASRISGTSLYRGQTVTLNCESEGATIYYTTDGSCPCIPATRIKYDGKPIPVNENVTIKALAIGLNGSESATSEYNYTIRQTDLKLQLKQGWNWTSHNKAEELSATELEKESVSRVLTQTGEIFKDPELGFVGNLGMVAAHNSMKVETTAATDIALTGEMYNPAASYITLHKGWNWLGYPLSQVMTVGEALAYLDAEEGDVISNLNGGFSQYANGAWTGELKTLSPGEGYLFKAASEKNFVFNDGIVSKARAQYGRGLNLEHSPWTVNRNRYPNMMCITAELMVGEDNVTPDSYHVAAFAGDECRGIGKYVDGVLLISVYGQGNETIRFVAVDRESENVIEIEKTLTFVNDVVGTASAPYCLQINADDIEDSETGMPAEHIYNLHGQKMNSISDDGIYIIDGKKVIMNNKNRNEKY